LEASVSYAASRVEQNRVPCWSRAQWNMQHTIHAEGFGVRLRPVRMDDAAFIVWLRNQDYVKGRVGDSASDVAAQEAWLNAYFQRAGDYYFLVETLGGIPLGTHGLYDISTTTAESGRYIIRPEVPAAVPSSILAYDLAFERLNIRELLAKCVSTNHTVHSLNRKFGFKEVGTVRSAQTINGKPVDLVQFLLTAKDWPGARKRLLPLAQYAETRVREWEKRTLEGAMSQAVQHN
jgi:RimJ/RimL family protein N-acetyltransferase